MSKNRPESIGSFMQLVRKGGPGGNADPYWVARWLFRWWTVYLSWVLVMLGFSANGVTLLSGVSVVVGGVMLGFPEPVWWVVGAGFVFLYHALDHCDGEVARYYRLTDQSSGGSDGAFWDSVVHGMEAVVVCGLGWRLYWDSGLGILPLVVAVADVAVLSVMPWQRYCEAIVGWVSRECKAGRDVRENRELLEFRDEGETTGVAGDMTFGVWLRQLLLFPGYYVTLLVAAILDFGFGPIEIGTDEGGGVKVRLYWLGIWLLIHAIGKVLSCIWSARRLAGRLRELS